MFWGLVIEPGKRYMQRVRTGFHLSMASLERLCQDNGIISLMLECEGHENVLCNLEKHKVMQCQLDLNFQAGEKIAFFSAGGPSTIHLTGYILEDDEEDDDFNPSEEEGEEEEEQEEEENEITDRMPMKKRKDVSSKPVGNKKTKLKVAGDSEEDEDNMSDTSENLKEEDEEESDVPLMSKFSKLQQSKTPGDKKKKKLPGTPNQQNGHVETSQSGKKNKNKQGGETPKSGTPGTPQKKILQGGVIIQDVKVGSGAVAESGKKISVYYVGRLKQNNKQFDSSTSGPGFKFNLGRSEVIKGWDIGVAGMRVGGKRTITVPPQMAYGKNGQPPAIPPNSTLIFDVELRNIQ